MHNKKQEKEMREAFISQRDTLLANPDRFIPDNPHAYKVGLESEVALYHRDATEETLRDIRNVVQRFCADFSDVELGAAQLEIRTPPVDIRGTGLRSLQEIYQDHVTAAYQITHMMGVEVLRCGTNPFLQTSDALRTNKPKYACVPDYHNRCRRKTIGTRIGLNQYTIEVGDAAVVSLFQSFQVNVQAASLADAVDKTNRSLMIGPYILALGGNSRYLECTDTGFNDLRIHAWQLSHDMRTPHDIRLGLAPRVGLPESYIAGIEDYFERIARHPFILYDPEHALQIGIGLTWLDTRIKSIGNAAVVEFRMLPTQPTIEDEIAFMLFYVGRLAYSQQACESLLPISFVRENRLAAIVRGMTGDYWVQNDSGVIHKIPGAAAIAYEQQRARQGLRLLHLEHSEFYDLIARHMHAISPSEVLARILAHKAKTTPEEMREALHATGMLV